MTLLALVLSSASCGGDDEGSAQAVTCEWFQAENCWKQMVAEATACFDSSAEGTFDATGTQCTYPDGTLVSFASPLPEDVDVDQMWNFTVESGGSQCLHFEELESGLRLSTASGTFEQTVSGSNVVIACPSGERVTIGAFAALECGFTTLPGFGWSGSSGNHYFSLMGGHEGEGSLFRCKAQ